MIQVTNSVSVWFGFRDNSFKWTFSTIVCPILKTLRCVCVGSDELVTFCDNVVHIIVQIIVALKDHLRI